MVSYDEFLEYFYAFADLETEVPVIGEQAEYGSGFRPYHWGTDELNRPAAWFMNTSVLKRKPRATKYSASTPNASRACVLMLDDIGSKSREAFDAAPPNAVLETSEGNFQAFYRLNPPADPAYFGAAVNACARYGLTDPGANNAVRWCRLPGSINKKPGRGLWPARVVRWEEQHEWSLDSVLAALGVVIEDEDWVNAGACGAPITLGSAASDPTLSWLAENGMVYGVRGNWYSITCPNAAQHSDGDPRAGYNASSGLAKCFHGHCKHVNTELVSEHIVSLGGPAIRLGGNHELLIESHAQALAARRRGAGFLPVGMRAEAQIESIARGIAPAEGLDRFLHEWLWAQRDNLFWRYGTPEYPIIKDSFDNLHKQLPTTIPAPTQKDPLARKKIAASAWWLLHRDPQATDVEGFTYVPGAGPIVFREGLRWGNCWVNRHVLGAAGDTSMWHAHMERLIPSLEERAHVLLWMGWHAQNPGLKCNHQLLIGGMQGIGKDSAFEPLLYAVGGPAGQRSNVGHCDLSVLDGHWGYHLENEIIVIQELKEQTSRGKRELANKMKPYWASPPDSVRIEHKKAHPYLVPNLSGWVIFTNFQDAISLEDSDRRLFVVWSEAPPLTTLEARALWAWYAGGGLDAVAYELHTMDVSAFNAGAVAPDTKAKHAMIERSRSDAETLILQMILERKNPFHNGIVAPTDVATFAALREAGIQSRIQVRRGDILMALEAAGWVCRGEQWARYKGEKLSGKTIWTVNSPFLNRLGGVEIRLALEHGLAVLGERDGKVDVKDVKQ